MIYTVTLNPALDYIVRMDKFNVGGINRVTYEQILAGGKGINVSIVLTNLGQENTAIGFVAGFTGAEIGRQLRERGVKSNFVELTEGFSRINVKAKADAETEINGQGPKISRAAQADLYHRLNRLKDGDTLVLAGSIPNTLPEDMYERIMEHLAGRGIRIVVDAEKELLWKVLPFHPFLIKPNRHEIGDMFGAELKSDEEILAHARKLQENGALHVLVSMGEDGAMLLTADGRSFRCPAPKGTLVNSVGAGDSMVAGFLTGFAESDGDLEKAFYMGIAAGSASAFSTELATRPEVEALLANIHEHS